MNGIHLQALQRCPLFLGVEPALLEERVLQARGEVRSFQRGDAIQAEESEKKYVGVVLGGVLHVYSDKSKGTLLNRLLPSSPLGVSGLYAPHGANSHIEAVSDGAVLFIEEEKADLLWEVPQIRRNLVAFLTGRIRFLTKRIASLTASSAEGRLAGFLRQSADETKSVVIPSCTALAQGLSLGRASLYRAIDTLSQAGAIRKTGKTIFILSEEILDRF